MPTMNETYEFVYVKWLTNLLTYRLRDIQHSGQPKMRNKLVKNPSQDYDPKEYTKQKLIQNSDSYSEFDGSTNSNNNSVPNSPLNTTKRVQNSSSIKNINSFDEEAESTDSGSLKEIPDNSSQNIEKKRSFFNIRKRKTKSTN